MLQNYRPNTTASIVLMSTILRAFQVDFIIDGETADRKGSRVEEPDHLERGRSLFYFDVGAAASGV